MQAVLKFDLPEDSGNHLIAVNAMEFALTCWEVDQKLRGWLKYGHKFKNADEAIEGTRNMLNDFMYSYNINLNMID